MPIENTVAIYAVMFAGLSAFAGIIAAIASWYSAKTASNLIESEANKDKRLLVLKLAKLAQEILCKSKSINKGCDALILQCTSLAIFNGGVGGSRQTLFNERIEKYRDEVTQIINGIHESSKIGESTENMSVERVSELLIIYTMKREEIISLEFDITNEKNELKSQLLIHQEKAIKN